MPARPKAHVVQHCLSGSGLGAWRSHSWLADSTFIFAQQSVFSGSGTTGSRGIEAMASEPERARPSRSRNVGRIPAHFNGTRPGFNSSTGLTGPRQFATTFAEFIRTAEMA